MAKGRKRTSRNRQEAEEDFDDTASVGTEVTTTSLGTNFFTGADGDEDAVLLALSDEVEKLYEKRSETREKALCNLFKGLCRYRYDWATERQQTLSDHMTRCVTRGKCNEQVAALKAFGILCVTLGGDSEGLLEEAGWWPVLVAKANDSPHDLVKAEAVLLLCLLVSLFDIEDEEEQSVLAVVESYIADSSCPPTLRVAALHGWGLVVGSKPPHQIAVVHYEQGIEMVGELFAAGGGNVEVLIAAGETLALLTDLTADQEVDHVYDINPSIGDHISDIASETAKKRNKKDKLKQRTAFRYIIATLDNGETASESIKIKHCVVDVNCWYDVCRLDAFRHLLGAGFLHHLTDNEFLHQVFDYAAPDSHEKLSQHDKRNMVKWSNSEKRERVEARGKNRRDKNHHHHTFSHDNDDDY